MDILTSQFNYHAIAMWQIHSELADRNTYGHFNKPI
jgi:hypothetical protein